MECILKAVKSRLFRAFYVSNKRKQTSLTATHHAPIYVNH